MQQYQRPQICRVRVRPGKVLMRSVHAVQNKVYEGAETQLEAAMKRIERRQEDDVIYGRNQSVRHLPRPLVLATPDH